jgi:hypothetical protein
MKSEAFSEWLASLSVSERIKALARIYLSLTVYSRELFVQDRTAGKEKIVLDMLHGLNEIHHTLSGQLVFYVTDENGTWPVEVLSQQLLQIANQYRIGNYLTSAVEFARTRT